MQTILWMPDGNPTVTRLGLVETEPGVKLTPADHAAMVEYRLDELIKESGLTLKSVKNLINDSLTPEGWEVHVTSMDSAAAEIMAVLECKLRSDGALIRYAETPMQEREGNRELWEEMDLENWLNRASMPPL